ncbi:hypothetical protein K440DRAFT_683693 [Wilcoxina mikolae CBS 423.85]|nr:hypothetical protein K440DRAFT_683693 [Wilcoxina mikolae CBS 423.85]
MVSGSLKLQPAGFMDDNMPGNQPFPSSYRINQVEDVALLTTVAGWKALPNRTAALPGTPKPASQLKLDVVLLGVNGMKRTPPEIVSLYPPDTTERMLRRAMEALLPNRVSMNLALIIVFCAGIHVKASWDTVLVNGVKREAVTTSSVKASINLNTQRFRLFAARCIIPPIESEDLRIHWADFINSRTNFADDNNDNNETWFYRLKPFFQHHVAPAYSLTRVWDAASGRGRFRGRIEYIRRTRKISWGTPDIPAKVFLVSQDNLESRLESLNVRLSQCIGEGERRVIREYQTTPYTRFEDDGLNTYTYLFGWLDQGLSGERAAAWSEM